MLEEEVVLRGGLPKEALRALFRNVMRAGREELVPLLYALHLSWRRANDLPAYPLEELLGGVPERRSGYGSFRRRKRPD